MISFCLLHSAFCISLTGCVAGTGDSAAVPVTTKNLATTQPSYWYDQPGQSVQSTNFDLLWNSCLDTSRDYLFPIDRRSYRDGVLTTKANVSPQWFEPWRRELQTPSDVADSTIASMRRSIRWEFTKLSSGYWSVSPKVLVERLSQSEQRITSAVSYRYAFGHHESLNETPKGTKESDAGILLPARYWYPVGRDEKFEAVLTKAIHDRVDVSK